MGWLEKLESKPSQPCLVQVNYPGAHNSDELKNKLFRVGGWLGGGSVGEAGNKTNSALLSWGLAKLGKKVIIILQASTFSYLWHPRWAFWQKVQVWGAPLGKF